MSDSQFPPRDMPGPSQPTPARKGGEGPPSLLTLIDTCLATLPEGDSRIPILYQMRQRVLEQAASAQQQDKEFKKLQSVVEKLTAPANRVGTFLGQSEDGLARIMVGGSEYYANIDPRLTGSSLKSGHQILVNEAFVVIRSLGYDRSRSEEQLRS